MRSRALPGSSDAVRVMRRSHSGRFVGRPRSAESQQVVEDLIDRAPHRDRVRVRRAFVDERHGAFVGQRRPPVDDLAQAFGFAQRSFEIAASRFADRVLECLEPQSQRGEWCAQLVARVR